MRNPLSIETVEALIAEEKISRAQTVLADFYKKLAELQNEIDELRGEKVSSTNKNTQIVVRVSDKELANLKRVTKKEGVTISELVRVRVPELSLSA
jgi:hypothetical protein